MSNSSKSDMYSYLGRGVFANCSNDALPNDKPSEKLFFCIGGSRSTMDGLLVWFHPVLCHSSVRRGEKNWR